MKAEIYKQPVKIIDEAMIANDVPKENIDLMVGTNNSGEVLTISTLVNNSMWIIDFGDTNHMTFDSR